MDIKEGKEEKKEEGGFGIFQHPLIPNDVEEILQKEIREFGGNSAHIVVPGRHAGKDAIITIKNTTKLKEERQARTKK